VKGSGKALWGIDPDALKGKMPASLPDVPEVREDMADYLGECQAVDAYLGVLLQRLEEAGQLERTLIVLSGDHGMPGIPDGKCNLYDQGTAVPLVVRLPGGVPGRVVDDLVRLPDLAPTFLELAGVPAPEGLYGRSLLPLLQSKKAGQIDPERNWVIFGRERHVDIAREEALPYPMRGLRTHDFLYIRNFAPDRWPLGAPRRVEDSPPPSQRELEEDTMLAFPDMDSSPTKAWLVAHHNEPEWTPYYTRAFGKRPAEELYDLRRDPDQMRNVAAAPEYQSARERLAADLLARLAQIRVQLIQRRPDRHIRRPQLTFSPHHPPIRLAVAQPPRQLRKLLPPPAALRRRQRPRPRGLQQPLQRRQPLRAI
jgi:uncharacterized sulfatase